MKQKARSWQPPGVKALTKSSHCGVYGLFVVVVCLCCCCFKSQGVVFGMNPMLQRDRDHVT